MTFLFLFFKKALLLRIAIQLLKLPALDDCSFILISLKKSFRENRSFPFLHTIRHNLFLCVNNFFTISMKVFGRGWSWMVFLFWVLTRMNATFCYLFTFDGLYLLEFPNHIYLFQVRHIYLFLTLFLNLIFKWMILHIRERDREISTTI